LPAIPGDELDVTLDAATPPQDPASPNSGSDPVYKAPAATEGVISAEGISNLQKIMAFGLIVAICAVIYRSRQASRAKALFQDKIMA